MHSSLDDSKVFTGNRGEYLRKILQTYKWFHVIIENIKRVQKVTVLRFAVELGIRKYVKFTVCKRISSLNMVEVTPLSGSPRYAGESVPSILVTYASRFHTPNRPTVPHAVHGRGHTKYCTVLQGKQSNEPWKYRLLQITQGADRRNCSVWQSVQGIDTSEYPIVYPALPYSTGTTFGTCVWSCVCCRSSSRSPLR